MYEADISKATVLSACSCCPNLTKMTRVPGARRGAESRPYIRDGRLGAGRTKRSRRVRQLVHLVVWSCRKPPARGTHDREVTGTELHECPDVVQPHSTPWTGKLRGAGITLTDGNIEFAAGQLRHEEGCHARRDDEPCGGARVRNALTAERSRCSRVQCPAGGVEIAPGRSRTTAADSTLSDSAAGMRLRPSWMMRPPRAATLADLG